MVVLVLRNLPPEICHQEIPPPSEIFPLGNLPPRIIPSGNLPPGNLPPQKFASRRICPPEFTLSGILRSQFLSISKLLFLSTFKILIE